MPLGKKSAKKKAASVGRGNPAPAPAALDGAVAGAAGEAAPAAVDGEQHAQHGAAPIEREEHGACAAAATEAAAEAAAAPAGGLTAAREGHQAEESQGGPGRARGRAMATGHGTEGSLLRHAREAAAAARQLVELGSDRLLAAGYPHRARPRAAPPGAAVEESDQADVVVPTLIRELNAATALLGVCLSALEAERAEALELETLLAAANEGMSAALARIEALEGAGAGADAEPAGSAPDRRAALESEVTLCRTPQGSGAQRAAAVPGAAGAGGRGGRAGGMDASTQTVEMPGAATEIQRMLRGMQARRDVQVTDACVHVYCMYTVYHIHV